MITKKRALNAEATILVLFLAMASMGRLCAARAGIQEHLMKSLLCHER